MGEPFGWHVRGKLCQVRTLCRWLDSRCCTGYPGCGGITTFQIGLLPNQTDPTIYAAVGKSMAAFSLAVQCLLMSVKTHPGLKDLACFEFSEKAKSGHGSANASCGPKHRDSGRELTESFITSAGQGGQNVNKVATAVQLRFDARNSPSLSSHVKNRLERLAGSRMTKDGVLIIEASRYRSQDRNRPMRGKD